VKYVLFTEEVACAQTRFVTPAKDKFVQFPLDGSDFNAKEVLSTDVAESFTDGAIRPEIRAIAEGATKNNNVYLANKLRSGARDHEGNPSGVASWFTPYPVPIIKNHDRESEPLGRVFTASDARFVKVGGQGNVFIYPTITDPEAVRKVLTQEYLTGSVGMRTDSAICSICQHDILKTMELCDHQKGRRYDKKGNEVNNGGTVANWILGNLWAIEYSFVNVPAFAGSGVMQTNTLQESFESSQEKSLYNVVLEDKELGFIIVDVKESKSIIAPDLEEGAQPDPKQDPKSEEGDSMLKKEDLAEAKLSTKQRKALPDSAFCGPNRSYPAHDAAHVRNGLARLSQYRKRMPASTYKKVLACLRNKAKKLGVKVSRKEGDEIAWIDILDFYKEMIEEAGISKMSEEDITKLTETPWAQEDTDGVVAAEEDQIKADDEALKELDGTLFCGPSQSWPVLTKEGAQVAKAMLTWESVEEKLDESTRAKILGMIETLESSLPEYGFAEGASVPSGTLECDYVFMANLIEYVMPRAIDAAKGSDQPAASSDDDDTPGESEDTTLKDQITQLEKDLKLREGLCAQLREQVQTITAERDSAMSEVDALQQSLAKLGSEYRDILIGQIIEVKQKRGTSESEDSMKERFSQHDPKALWTILRELSEEAAQIGDPATSSEPSTEVPEATDSTTPDGTQEDDPILNKAGKALKKVGGIQSADRQGI